MKTKYWAEIGIYFIVGLFVGIIAVATMHIVCSAGAILWARILRAILSGAFMVAGFITIARAYRDKPIISDPIDQILLGITCGISGSQLFVSGLLP